MKYLILGGTSGIGLDLAKKLSKKNDVYILGRNFKDIKDLKLSNVHLYKHEVQSFNKLDNFFKEDIYNKTSFDGIVNCIGVERFKMSKLISENDLNEVFLPPIISFMIILKYASKKGFINDNGSIITMSSVSSVRGKSGMLLYGSARATLESMVLHSASELSKRNIRINAIRAGAILTPMHVRSTKNMNEASLKEFRKKHLLGFGSTSDVVSIIEFLFSKKSKWITGTTITADGGYLSE